MIARCFYFFCCLVGGILLHQSYKIQNFGFGYAGPEVFPKAITGVFFFMSIVLLIKSFIQQENYDRKLILNKRQAVMFVGFILYVLSIRYIGYLYTTPVYIALTIFYLVPHKGIKDVARAVTIGVLTTGAVFYVFAVKLKVFLPEGVLGL